MLTNNVYFMTKQKMPNNSPQFYPSWSNLKPDMGSQNSTSNENYLIQMADLGIIFRVKDEHIVKLVIRPNISASMSFCFIWSTLYSNSRLTLGINALSFAIRQ